MSSDTIRIGVVGAGSMATATHIPHFQAIEGVEVVSVANRSRESGERVAEAFNIPNVYDSWADLIAAPESNAICIGTWPYMHRTLTLEALQHEKHVLTEARYAMNAQEARDMLDASRAKPHLVTQVVPAPFTLKVDSTIVDMMADGFLGNLVSVDLAAHNGFAPRPAPYTWRHDRDVSGYNTLMLGAWNETLTRWLGPASSVTAMTKVTIPTRVDGDGNLNPATVPDHVEVLYETAAGAVVHMRLSEVTGLAPPDQVWLFGTDGTLHLEIIDLDTDKIVLRGGRRDDAALSEVRIPPEKQAAWRVEEEFVNAIRGIEPVTHNTFETGVKYMEFTEAVARSAQTGRTVYLPL